VDAFETKIDAMRFGTKIEANQQRMINANSLIEAFPESAIDEKIFIKSKYVFQYLLTLFLYLRDLSSRALMELTKSLIEVSQGEIAKYLSSQQQSTASSTSTSASAKPPTISLSFAMFSFKKLLLIGTTNVKTRYFYC
jgi:hypothetical protein